jgi:RND family efflux transporter MFP subunit
MKGWIAVGLCLAVGGGCGHSAPQPGAKAEDNGQAELPVVKAAVMTVEKQPWPTIVKTQGSLIADEVAVVGAKVGGRVAQVGFDLGDTIAAGAELAVLDQEEFKLQIVLAEAQLTQARAALGLAPASPVESLKPENAPPVREAKVVWEEVIARIERLKPLAARNAVTKDELEQALADEGVASAKYSAAVNGVREKIALIGVRAAELSVAQQRMDDTTIRAPFEGLVQQRHVAPGTYLQVGDPVATLVRTSTLRFRGTIPERHAYRLASGQQVTLQIESVPEPLVATITRISPNVEEMNRSLTFEAEVPNTEGRLRAGLFAEAEVVVDPEAMALIVPRSAIVEFAGAEKVWKLVDGVAQEQTVQTSRRADKVVEIVGGLAAGETILVQASEGRVARIEPVMQESGVGGQESGVESQESESSTADATGPSSRAAE